MLLYSVFHGTLLKVLFMWCSSLLTSLSCQVQLCFNFCAISGLDDDGDALNTPWDFIFGVYAPKNQVHVI
jgi:hypothetical protein